MADAEVAAAEKLLLAAEIQHARAVLEKDQLASELGQDAGRIESGKAAAGALIGGLFGFLPATLIQSGGAPGLEQLLGVGAAAASCALFGVTYRYAGGL